MGMALYLFIGAMLAIILVLVDAAIFKFGQNPKNRSIVTTWAFGIFIAWPIVILGLAAMGAFMGVLIAVESTVDWVYGEFK